MPPYNPANVPNSVEVSLVLQLQKALVNYFENQLGSAFYRSEVLPLIKKICESGTTKLPLGKAVALTGDFIVENGAIVWVRNKTAKMILRETGCMVTEDICHGLLGAANIFGWLLLLSSEAGAESMELQWEYKNYLKKYLTYMMKVGALGGNHIDHMIPPISYPQWLESGDARNQTWWWQ